MTLTAVSGGIDSSALPATTSPTAGATSETTAPNQTTSTFAELLLATTDPELDMDGASPAPGLTQNPGSTHIDLSKAGLQSFFFETAPAAEENAQQTPAEQTASDSVANAYVAVATLQDIPLQPVTSAQAPPAEADGTNDTEATSLAGSILGDALHPRIEGKPEQPDRQSEEDHGQSGIAMGMQAVVPAPYGPPVAMPAATPDASAEVSGSRRQATGDIASLESTAAAASKAPVILEARITAKADAANDHSPEPVKSSVESLSQQTTPKAVAIDSRMEGNGERNEQHGESTADTPHTETETAVFIPSGSAETTRPAANATHKPASAAAPAEPILIQENQPLPGAERTPLKQIDLRIPDANGDITVRVQERAGAVHVSVRSNDSQIAENAAAGLTDLTRALDREGFRAEAWTPQSLKGLEGRAEEVVASSMTAAHSENGGIRSESSQAEDEHSQNSQEMDWQDQQEKRRKRHTEEDFKEYL